VVVWLDGLQSRLLVPEFDVLVLAAKRGQQRRHDGQSAELVPRLLEQPRSAVRLSDELMDSVRGHSLRRRVISAFDMRQRGLPGRAGPFALGERWWRRSLASRALTGRRGGPAAVFSLPHVVCGDEAR